MIRVELTGPDISLLTDPTTVVQLPWLTATPKTQHNAVADHYDNEADPVLWSGIGRTQTWQMSCRFLHDQQAQAQQLIRLFETARRAADGRLFVRRHGGMSAGLVDSVCVGVTEWDLLFSRPGQVTVTWPATTVSWTPDVRGTT